MKHLFVAVALVAAFTAQAGTVTGFDGAYAPGNWTQSLGNGSVDVFDANTLTMTSGSSSDFSGVFTDVSFAGFTGNAIISFDWAFDTQGDDPFWEIFGYKATPAGTFTDISDQFGNEVQSGSFSYTMPATGGFFGFSLWSVDGVDPSSTVTITNFSVTTPGMVPEPGSLALVAAALGAGLAVRRRRAV